MAFEHKIGLQSSNAAVHWFLEDKVDTRSSNYLEEAATEIQDELPRLYYALNFLNETRSLVIITNRELSSWSEGAMDGHMVETLVARLTAGSQIIAENANAARQN